VPAMTEESQEKSVSLNGILVEVWTEYLYSERLTIVCATYLE
jgi:hypothetical protein